MRFLLLFLFCFGLAVILYKVYRIFNVPGVSPAKIRSDAQSIRLMLREYIESLLPFDDDAIATLSAYYEVERTRLGLGEIRIGRFFSIFQEPLLAFGMKKYSGQEEIIMLSTADDDYMYHTIGTDTKLYINNHLKGVIDQNGGFYSAAEHSLIGKIDPEPMLSCHPVEIGGRRTGEVVNILSGDSSTKRALLLMDQMNDHEKETFLGLVFLSMVEEVMV